MLELYRQLFNTLHEAHIEYCIWKNVQEAPEALAGTGDIDLYIYPQSHARFVSTLRMQGFTRVDSHKPTPCVEHYYGFDAPSNKFCHLHCYFRIVTGESHIKQYVIPVEDFLSVLPSQLNDSGVSEMHPVLQHKLNLFRRAVKLSCLPGALLFLREKRGYRDELFLLEQALQAVSETDRRNGNIGWLASIQPSVSLTGEILKGMKYRILFRHWSRFPPLATPIFRYGTILKRLAGKLRRKRKMLPLGITIAVTGASGHEIEELEDQLAEWLGEHFAVVSVDAVGGLRRPGNANSDVIDSSGDPGPGNAASVLWHSCKRYRRVNSALRHTMSASIVIWRGLQPQTIQQAADILPPMKTGTQSTMATLLSSDSGVRLGAAPGVDILLQSNAESIKDFSKQDQSIASPADFQPDPTAAPVPERYPRVINAEGGAWKHEVWHALVALQP